jgi:hypothetical protein
MLSESKVCEFDYMVKNVRYNIVLKSLSMTYGSSLVSTAIKTNLLDLTKVLLNTKTIVISKGTCSLDFLHALFLKGY